MQGALPRLFVGGGQGYYDETANRDKLVVERTALELFNKLGNSIEIVTGGMPGIPEDFALAWIKAGGKHVFCVVSSEHEPAYLARNLPFKHMIAGETQLQRRIAVTALERIFCALFVQGGKFSTHEIQLFEQRKIPIVAFTGSGGAAGGGQPYEGYTYKCDQSKLYASTDPNEDVEKLAKSLVEEISL